MGDDSEAFFALYEGLDNALANKVRPFRFFGNLTLWGFILNSIRLFVAALSFSTSAHLCLVAVELPIADSTFWQPYQDRTEVQNGLPKQPLVQIALDSKGVVFAATATEETFVRRGDRWIRLTDTDAVDDPIGPLPWYPSLKPDIESPDQVRDVAQHVGEIAVAAKSGLYLGDGQTWAFALPSQGETRWAPLDVRAVCYDTDGRLWFCSPQGVGCRVNQNEWHLYTGADGLPYNDFTCMSAGSSGIWFGTTDGVIQYYQGQWQFRQGGRWLPNDQVHDLAVDEAGDVWIATADGVSIIKQRPETLASKATFYEAEIETYHRRTRFGYVNPAILSTPGDKSTARPTYSDNDGFNTGLFLGAMSLAYSVTEQPKYRDRADQSFRALAFLSQVTQGGPHAGQKGLIARNVIPTSEPDPNLRYDRQYDVARKKRDDLWKLMPTRLPIDATGQWYWKCDASSDELDGHFFGYAIYFDHVCENERQKEAVRVVVRSIIDHLIANDYNLVDYDGQPTRWGHFAPDDLNRNPAWHEERGLNSYSILTYLLIANHITGDPKYRDAYLQLANDHGYAMNGMSQPKALPGPGSQGHQPDDNMAFMNYYHLIRYEDDPRLLNMYQYAIQSHWRYEQLERNAFTNFIYGACARGKTRQDQWRTSDLSPPQACYEDAVNTLRRYPIDLIEWPMSNAHRIDLMPLGGKNNGKWTYGGRVDGYAFPIDQRHETYWDWDPWKLTSHHDGTVLRPGFHYLVAYYLGRHHGFIGESP